MTTSSLDETEFVIWTNLTSLAWGWGSVLMFIHYVIASCALNNSKIYETGKFYSFSLEYMTEGYLNTP